MTDFLLVTANVGSIFEDPDGILKLWVREFLQTVATLRPTFIALHCQEFGGKNYENSLNKVDEFVRTLFSSKELSEFEQSRVFLDEDYSSSDKFTALGNLYFVHKSQEAHIWDYNERLFVPVVGKEVHSGNIEHVSIKDKLKFPQHFFPEFKWSRKGFMKTRWLLNGVAFDLVNIHLFHDESNFVAITEFPSAYTKNRRKALEYTLKLCKDDAHKNLPLFIFGDFNFRLDTKEVIRKLTNNAKPSQIFSSNGDPVKYVYRNGKNNHNLTVEKKHFYFSDQNFFTDRSNLTWLLEQDKEPSHFKGIISELKIGFPPSYPFNEEMSATGYMNTRCPSWCDRVMMNQHARRLLLDPVYVYFQLAPNRETLEGTVSPIDHNHDSHSTVPEVRHYAGRTHVNGTRMQCIPSHSSPYQLTSLCLKPPPDQIASDAVVNNTCKGTSLNNSWHKQGIVDLVADQNITNNERLASRARSLKSYCLCCIL